MNKKEIIAYLDELADRQAAYDYHKLMKVIAAIEKYEQQPRSASDAKRNVNDAIDNPKENPYNGLFNLTLMDTPKEKCCMDVIDYDERS